MSGVVIRRAQDEAEAREILVAATRPNDSFTQRQLFSEEHIDRALRLGYRRADWVWVATGANDGKGGSDDSAHSDGETIGVVSGWGAEHRDAPWVLDFFDLARASDEVALDLIERAAADTAGDDAGQVELILFLPTETPLNDPTLARFVAILARARFRMLVRRRRYRLVVEGADVRLPDTQLRFEPIAGAEDPRLVSVLAEILVGSLDAHDLAALEKSDLDRVAQETAVEYLEMDAPESVFLAFDSADELVGLVIGGLRGGGSNGTASFIGVSHRHRGHGYAAQLLGWITARMIAAGAETIIGETDDGNFPMARAFEAVGYPQTESRIDFQRAGA